MYFVKKFRGFLQSVGEVIDSRLGQGAAIPGLQHQETRGSIGSWLDKKEQLQEQLRIPAPAMRATG